jgi:hypothetical protein
MAAAQNDGRNCGWLGAQSGRFRWKETTPPPDGFVENALVLSGCCVCEFLRSPEGILNDQSSLVVVLHSVTTLSLFEKQNKLLARLENKQQQQQSQQWLLAFAYSTRKEVLEFPDPSSCLKPQKMVPPLSRGLSED